MNPDLDIFSINSPYHKVLSAAATRGERHHRTLCKVMDLLDTLRDNGTQMPQLEVLVLAAIRRDGSTHRRHDARVVDHDEVTQT